jgi:hypothetical protein
MNSFLDLVVGGPVKQWSLRALFSSRQCGEIVTKSTMA